MIYTIWDVYNLVQKIIFLSVLWNVNLKKMTNNE